MLSVCHTVVVVQDQLVDTSLWDFLKTALMLKYRIPDVSTIGLISYSTAITFEPPPVADEFTGNLVFAINRLDDDLPMPASEEEKARSRIRSIFGESARAFFIPDSDAQDSSTCSLSKHLEQFTLSMLEVPSRTFKRPLSHRDW